MQPRSNPGRPPILPHTLAPLAPVHYDIIDHLLHLAPTTYMRLSKAHHLHALHIFSQPFLIDHSFEDRFYKTTTADQAQSLAFLLPAFYAEAVRVDDVRIWAGLAVDFGRVYNQRKRRKAGSGFACENHPDRLFRHVRQIGVSLSPFATIPSLTEKAAREKNYQLKNLFDQSVDHEIGKHFEELAIFVDKPFLGDTDSKQYAFDHFLPTGHWARQKMTVIYIPFFAKGGPSIDDLRVLLPTVLAQNLEYHSSKIIIYPSSGASQSCAPSDVATIIARYLAGRARLRAARHNAGNRTVFDIKYAEFHVPEAESVRGLVMPFLCDEVRGRFGSYRAEMERDVRIVELDPALVVTSGYRRV
ncbi:hypothetical protein L202_04598 [Cryptococcus amylolentus CBS 6039]|uniref:Uncharacterized protein n=1 Tax=Cryptococcus amylolentus CBS 6039 TaxID=1295533 RepID=A0A1E3HM53_9TREE|nr:hypothetical protein L202_04598 [Cryptococcus amylolentus CBS 6039]ODN77418.1 hypothetical protein L202_04598 [Cryptococcus amylolentus CBS 6039]